ncbi:DUF6879 family protein [Amycolatopsis sp. RTGN1]|uniref:DUF6879 family protein n=1 Tax=Amycolatopsis ponsaeliensis TaxID=2992142 RepID=UPI0025513C4C|nr:DUF6879 family protein [Amycolatopsis sp. RTGN1]
MHRPLVTLPGDRLTPDEYFSDYDRNFWHTDNTGCWKLERQQHFVESGNASWDAFNRGDWSKALRLMEERRQALADYENRIAGHGFEVRRIRIVEEPLSPYLIWELNSLHVRFQVGGKIRVVDGGVVAGLELHEVLPELFILGKKVIYQVLYTESGELEGAIRSDVPDLIQHWTATAGRLYDQGEDLGGYFAQKVAGRQPPPAW